MVYDSDQPPSIPTLADALQSQTVDYLKELADLVSEEKNKPVRKPDLIQFILRRVHGEPGQLRQVESDPLQGFWRRLDQVVRLAATGTGRRFGGAEW